MKQSSVEWLHHEFERIDKEFHVGSHEYNYAKNLAFKISKAMHKEEMIQSYSNGWHDGQDIIINGITHIQVGGDAAGQDYYKQTFGGEQ